MQIERERRESIKVNCVHAETTTKKNAISNCRVHNSYFINDSQLGFDVVSDIFGFVEDVFYYNCDN